VRNRPFRIAANDIEASDLKNTKGRPLGERPAFLRSPLGCGNIEALGCVGRGLREAAWEAASGL